VHWAVWDTQVNLPVVYLMDGGFGRKPAERRYRWPQAQHALMAQAIGGLKLTIATGFDKDFADLHPKRLRRIIWGRCIRRHFTLQSGRSQGAGGSKAPGGRGLGAGLDGGGSGHRPRGSGEGRLVSVGRQVYKLDPVAGAELGCTRQERMIILPEKPYQVLVEQNPKGQGLRKFVVGAGGGDSDVVICGRVRGRCPGPGIFLDRK
jgi:hypothetical protein